MNLPTHQYLDERGLAYCVLTFPETIEKGAASVTRELGFRERQMVKSLLFQTGEGEVVLVLLGGDQSAKTGLLKKAVGSRNVQMASPDVVQATTGYAVGSIPPFHWQPPGFRSFLETALMDEEELGVGAGQWGHEIVLAPRALKQAARAEVVSLVEHTS